jgi:hypothetical protein
VASRGWLALWAGQETLSAALLVRLTQVMRYGTRERLKTALRELGSQGD